MTISKKRSIFDLPMSELNPTLKVLDYHGVTRNHFDLLRAENGANTYARRVARAFTHGGFKSSTDTRIARILLGKSLIDVCDWVGLYGARFTAKEKKTALKFPWDEDVLMSPDHWEPEKLVKDTHTAFLGVEKIDGAPLTVAKLIGLHPATGQPKFYYSDDPWHAGQPYTDVATLLPRWYLLRNETIPGSTGKDSDEQMRLIPPEYELPSTIAETTKDLLVFKKTGERPNGSRWARCVEKTVKTEKVSGGYWSIVGDFDEYGLFLYYWYGNRYIHVGCGAARKS